MLIVTEEMLLMPLYLHHHIWPHVNFSGPLCVQMREIILVPHWINIYNYNLLCKEHKISVHGSFAAWMRRCECSYPGCSCPRLPHNAKIDHLRIVSGRTVLVWHLLFAVNRNCRTTICDFTFQKSLQNTNQLKVPWAAAGLDQKVNSVLYNINCNICCLAGIWNCLGSSNRRILF